MSLRLLWSGRTLRYVYEGRGDTGGSCQALKSRQVNSKPTQVSLHFTLLDLSMNDWKVGTISISAILLCVCGVWWSHVILTSLLSPNVILRWSPIWLSENSTYEVLKTVSVTWTRTECCMIRYPLLCILCYAFLNNNKVQSGQERHFPVQCL